MPPVTQRIVAFVCSFILGCGLIVVVCSVTNPSKTKLNSSRKKVESTLIPNRSKPDFTASETPALSTQSRSDPVDASPTSSSGTINPMKDMKCAEKESWSCLGTPFNKGCGILLGHDEKKEPTYKALVEQVKNIRSYPYFGSVRIGLVTNSLNLPPEVKQHFDPVVNDVKMPSAMAFEILNRSPFPRSLYMNRSARIWVKIVAPIHFAMDLLQYHDVLMTAAPKWDGGLEMEHEVSYQSGVIMARTASLCVKDFLKKWKDASTVTSDSAIPMWPGAEEMMSITNAVRRSYVRLLPLPPEFCVNDVLGKDECIDWKRRWKGLNVKCDQY